MLTAGTHVDYVRQLEELRLEHAEILDFNKLCRQLEVSFVLIRLWG